MSNTSSSEDSDLESDKEDNKQAEEDNDSKQHKQDVKPDAENAVGKARNNDNVDDEEIFVGVNDVPELVDNLNQEEPLYEEMEMAELVGELQLILDHIHLLIQGALQENPVNDDIDDMLNVDGERLFFIMAQLNELFPEGIPEDPPNDLDDIMVAYHNPGDYILGNRIMESLLARLFEDENDDHGPPPMEPEDIANIPTIMVEQEMLDRCSSCPVCIDTIQLKEEVNILGCGHFFHAFCIRTWLGMHASCPVCRRVVGEEEGGEGAVEEEEVADEWMDEDDK